MCTWAFLLIKKKFILIQFSLYFGENFLVGSRRKYLDPTIYFHSSSPNQTHSKKFSFLFSFQNFPSTLVYLQTNTPLGLIICTSKLNLVVRKFQCPHMVMLLMQCVTILIHCLRTLGEPYLKYLFFFLLFQGGDNKNNLLGYVPFKSYCMTLCMTLFMTLCCN